MKVDPLVGEGFRLDSGEPASAIGDREIFLRSFGDDIKALLHAYQEERRLGREHPEWLAWCRRFGDWLHAATTAGWLSATTWKPGSGEVVSASPNSSYNTVRSAGAALVEYTGRRKYLAAAIAAANFCWESSQSRGCFVGGTIDNPDVLDKEAATLSLEAYLALYEATADKHWIDCARAAADFAETWIYVWNVPMPADDQSPDIHWKHGVSTVGLQLISSGHSLVDAYMAFDTDEFAKVYRITGDRHYRDVARLLLHNTRTCLRARPHIRSHDAWLAAGALEPGPTPRLRSAPRLVAVGGDQPAERHLRIDGPRRRLVSRTGRLLGRLELPVTAV